MCYALMDKLSYDNYVYYDGEVDVDSDDSDYSTDSSDGEEDVDVLVVKQKTKYSSSLSPCLPKPASHMSDLPHARVSHTPCQLMACYFLDRWKCKTKVKFYADKSMTIPVAELKVKAKGKAKKKDTLVRVLPCL